MNELKIGDQITIRFSKKLEQNGTGILTNKTGTVTRVVVCSGNITGAYVDVLVMRRIKNYYVPISSIEGPGKINEMRTLSLLKTITL